MDALRKAHSLISHYMYIGRLKYVRGVGIGSISGMPAIEVLVSHPEGMREVEMLLYRNNLQGVSRYYIPTGEIRALTSVSAGLGDFSPKKLLVIAIVSGIMSVLSFLITKIVERTVSE